MGEYQGYFQKPNVHQPITKHDLLFLESRWMAMLSQNDNLSITFEYCGYFYFVILHVSVIILVVNEILEIWCMMNVIFIHEESSYDVFIQEAVW
jgi:hypothetical protein